jgi:hypothetical protein
MFVLVSEKDQTRLKIVYRKVCRFDSGLRYKVLRYKELEVI